MNVDGLAKPNGATKFMRAHSGMLAAFALLVAGGMGALWIAGIIALPSTVTDMQAESAEYYKGMRATTDSLRTMLRKTREDLDWTICEAVPPITRSERQALRVRCVEDDRPNRVGLDEQGFP